MERYDARAIEGKWQQVWAEEGTWEVANPGQPGFDGSKPKAYVLEMLPYPSGEPHVGHLKCYAVGDAIAHYRRRHGFQVIHPMGYDAFGLPAENNAIKTGEAPREATERSIESFRRQFREWGISIDWSREIGTHTPEYYRWTQWIFLRLFEEGLAYRTEAPVQWCPKDATVLANEQVVDGRCERCGTQVVQKKLEQWFFKITEYADRLLADFDLLESWPEHVITMQRNWIGRSEGAEVVFRCEEGEVGLDFPVFTTRPDTLFGATFFVLAPEHPELERLVAGTEAEQPVREYVDRVAPRVGRGARRRGPREDRRAARPQRGQPGQRRGDPDVRRRLRADGVRDRRDHGGPRPRHARLRVREEVRAADSAGDRGRGRRGRPRRAGPALSGRRRDDRLGSIRRQGQPRGLRRDRRVAEGGRPRRGLGQLPPPRLAGLAPALLGGADPDRLLRECGAVPVPEEQLPVELPEVDDYAPQGKSPLAAAEDWVATECPKCGGPGRRETDTMDTFVDSSWYFIRYLDPANGEAAWDRSAADHWLPVDQYIGGVEHAILHLMYARFLTKALADLGHLGVQEPFANLFAQGMITRDGAKMSKSRGNTVAPSEYVESHGADTARTYICFMGPPERGGDWSDEGLEGVGRFLARLWRLCAEVDERTAAGEDAGGAASGPARELLAKAHWAIDKATTDFERGFQFNTAISAVMELVNDSYRLKDGLFGSPEGDAALRFATATAASLVFPFAPHLGAEVWERLEGGRVWEVPWPVADPAMLVSDTVTLVVQINGKLRDRIEVAADASKDELLALARESANVSRHLDGAEIVKEIVVPGKLVNLVVR